MSTEATPLPATKTVADLYEALDWAGVERASRLWSAQYPSSNTPSDEFIVRFRKGLLAAVFCDQPEHQKEAIRLLQEAGVWIQIVAYLKAHQLWND